MADIFLSYAKEDRDRVAGYDVAPDGRRFVMVRPKNLQMPTVIHVVLNWPEALRASNRE